jgi:Domain of unknown function (DUF1996)
VSPNGPGLDASSAPACARPRSGVLLALTGLALVVGLVGTSTAAGSSTAHAIFPGGAYFNLACGFSHRNNDDPILFPGQPGKSHNHTYIGNTSVDAASTPASLRRGETTCEIADDSSTYWVPTLYLGREPVVPYAGLVYYVRLTSESVSAFPPDLKIVAGNPTARKAQRRDVASWSCGGVGSSRRFALVQACAEDEMLELRVQFPSCWNGKNADSPNHRRHMAYAKAGRCPSTHPVAVPTLIIVLLYPPLPRGAAPSSGRFAAHADFMNGWDQKALERLVASLNY